MPSRVPGTKTIYDASTKTWSGVQSKPKYGQECSIGQVAFENLLKDPQHISQICYHNGKEYTNRDIATYTIRVAQHFKTLKVKQGDVIGICAVNSDYLAPLVFGALLSGVTISTLDPSFDKDGIKHIFSITKPKLMFCDGAIHQTVKEAFAESGLKADIITMKDHVKGVPEITEYLKETGLESSFKPEPLKEGHNQIAFILCSSGTTGLPKGVSMSHASLLHSMFFELNHDDRLLSFSTLYWASGLFCLLAGTFQGATRIISENGFSPEDFLDIIEKHRVSVIFTPPSQIAMTVAHPKITDSDLSSVRTYLCGGSAVPFSLVEKIRPYMANAEFVVGYGMSEVCGAIALGEVVSSGSTGQIMDNCGLRVVDDDGKLLGPGEVGELLIRTQFHWSGYYGNPEATKAIYETDGWTHSGDIGYVDSEGNVYVVDRKKDILKYNNFHFFPTEIEIVIGEIPGVAEVCVCGIPDIVSTHLPAAAIVKSPESSLTEEEVYQIVASKMAHFKHLRGGVFFMDELPKTVSGKYLRRKVTEVCEALRNDKL